MTAFACNLSRLATLVRLALIANLAVALTGCGSVSFSLIDPGSREVAAQTMLVSPSDAWNRMPRRLWHFQFEEFWTRNGAPLDRVTFKGGIAEGKDMVRYAEDEKRRVPAFRADMTDSELVAMVEASYRIRDGATSLETLAPVSTPFLGVTGLQIDCTYVGPDSVRRKGRTVLAVVDDKLYQMTLDGEAQHYFAAALPEFDAMTRGARVR